MPYSEDWIAYMNAWADQKPLKPTDRPFVFKSTMEYSETGITGDVKEITRTFDTSGTVLDLHRHRLDQRCSTRLRFYFL